MAALGAMATLARWLGPWGARGVPRGVVRTSTMLEAAHGGDRERVRTPLRVDTYRRERGAPVGAYLVVPGLHYLGPEDPRFDRFARILASAGFVVVAPFLPDHLALRIAPGAADDLAIAFEHTESITKREALPAPAIFSISFGSLPAIALAASDAYRARVGALVLFGGYADFDAAVRFALTGRAHDGDDEARAIAMAHDPLNAPVVWLYLLPHLAVACDKAAVARAWRTMVERTWGREEMKRADARRVVADDVANGLGDTERALFLSGCGLRDFDRAASDAAFRACAKDVAFADARPHLERVTAPVVVIHGKDDDVIPWLEADKIRAALAMGRARHTVLVTGMYGHTGASLPSPRALARELRTMLDVVSSIASAATGEL